MEVNSLPSEFLLQKLKNSGLKLTHQRIEVFKEVAARVDHPDAATIYECVKLRCPTISLDTVYRTLAALKDAGLITTMGPVHERQRFDANIAPHHHFVCTICGRAEDFVCDNFNSLPVPPEVAAFGTVKQSHVELRGVCSNCANKT